MLWYYIQGGVPLGRDKTGLTLNFHKFRDTEDAIHQQTTPIPLRCQQCHKFTFMSITENNGKRDKAQTTSTVCIFEH